MKLKVWEYKSCSTCRKAMKHLEAKGIECEVKAIRETPPSKEDLKKMLTYVKDLKRLFNTSGVDYREMKIKDRISSLSVTEAFELLSKNGNLVKRPFVLGKNGGVVGFQEDEWKTFLKSE